MKILRNVGAAVWWLLLAAFLIVNLRLYSPSPLPEVGDSSTRNIFPQLRAQERYLKNDSAVDMQNLFPEGYVFSYLFHGLTWVEIGLRYPWQLENAIAKAKWTLTFVDQQEASAPFPKDLPPDHGMFYACWRAHLVAGIARIDTRP